MNTYEAVEHINSLLERVAALECGMENLRREISERIGVTHQCGDDCKHASDCAVHNAPAYLEGACNCWEVEE